MRVLLLVGSLSRVCKRVIDNRAKFMRETGLELPNPR